MKIKLINIYSFPVRAKTDWLILEIVCENNIKGYSELTLSLIHISEPTRPY